MSNPPRSQGETDCRRKDRTPDEAQRLHHFKRLLVRYDRRGDIHEAFLALGCCCLVCYRRVKTSL
jgi:hypothetical protein